MECSPVPFSSLWSSPTPLLLSLKEKGCGYVNGVNDHIQSKTVTLSTSCGRLESALQKIAGRLCSKLRQCKGSRDRAKVRSGSTNFLVGEGKTVTLEEATQPLQVHMRVCECECVPWMGEGRGRLVGTHVCSNNATYVF